MNPDHHHRTRVTLLLSIAAISTSAAMREAQARPQSATVRNGLGDRAGTCIDPKTQIVREKVVCVVSCQRSPEPVFLKWKGMEGDPGGDFFVRSGPSTVKLSPDSASQYIRTRFGELIPHGSLSRE